MRKITATTMCILPKPAIGLSCKRLSRPFSENSAPIDVIERGPTVITSLSKDPLMRSLPEWNYSIRR